MLEDLKALGNLQVIGDEKGGWITYVPPESQEDAGQDTSATPEVDMTDQLAVPALVDDEGRGADDMELDDKEWDESVLSSDVFECMLDELDRRAAGDGGHEGADVAYDDDEDMDKTGDNRDTASRGTDEEDLDFEDFIVVRPPPLFNNTAGTTDQDTQKVVGPDISNGSDPRTPRTTGLEQHQPRERNNPLTLPACG